MPDPRPDASPDPDPDALLDLAIAVASRAGRLALEGRQRGLGDVGTKSSSTDMVTDYDRAAERLIVDAIRRARADDAVVGEEGADQPGSSGISWLVDPIDGTTNFLYDLPGWAVSVAAADAAGTLVGVVNVPTLGEMYTAVRGRGARRNGRPIRCSAKSDLATALIATGFSYDPSTRVRQAEAVSRLLGRIRDVRRFGAAAVDLCFVADGRIDGYFEAGLNPWDLAAGTLIAREAGARTVDLGGTPDRPGLVVVANPALFDRLVDLVRTAGMA